MKILCCNFGNKIGAPELQIGMKPISLMCFFTHISLFSWWCYCIALTLGNCVCVFGLMPWQMALSTPVCILVLTGNWMFLCLLILWMNRFPKPVPQNPPVHWQTSGTFIREEEARLFPLLKVAFNLPVKRNVDARQRMFSGF